MKNNTAIKIASFMIKIFIAINLIGCCNKNDPSEVNKYFEGEHELRKMVSDRYIKTQGVEGSAYFIFGVGGGSITGGDSRLAREVTFSWKNIDEEYIITTLPISSIRVKFGNYPHPKVKFKWLEGFSVLDSNNPSWHIIYAVILCSPEQWAENIALPLNENSYEK